VSVPDPSPDRAVDGTAGAAGAAANGGSVDAEVLTRWLEGFADRVAAERDHLTALDAAIGDADHGSNLDRGMAAVRAALPGLAGQPPGAVLKKAATTLISTVGGASGPLYGTFFLRMAGAIELDAAGLDAAGLAAALRAGVDGVAARGKAEPGDKTMLDALRPAVDALDAALADGGAAAGAVEAGGGPGQALAVAARAAAEGRDATTGWVARKGRASYLGERAIGHTDPGATSATLLLEALAAAVGAADRS
jgi:dihydroxyacetone kinase-like protein